MLEPRITYGRSASEEAIKKLISSARIELPPAYLAFLRKSSGAEGPLSIEPGWICLWPADKIPEYNEAYQVQINAPGFYGIGSNGGSELIAFDTRSGHPWPIAMIPFVPMDPAEAITIAADIASFILTLGRAMENEH